jgi:alpha-galactosidase
MYRDDPVNGYTTTGTSNSRTTTTATSSSDDASNTYNYKPPIQVYILAGQSNMVGMGSITHLDQLIQYNDTSRTSDISYRTDNHSNEYRDTLWNSTTGNYKVRDDVYIVYQTHSGRLTVSRTAGYAGGADQFGPELLFGWTMAEQQQEQVRRRKSDSRHINNNHNSTDTSTTMILLIKVAYGGRDLAIDFRPPSAGIGNYSIDPDHYGWEYRVMINDTKRVLHTIDQYIPNFVEQYNSSYELKGFVWFQGWNDLLSWQKVNEYESNLAHLIRDIRSDLNHSNLPFGRLNIETISILPRYISSTNFLFFLSSIFISNMLLQSLGNWVCMD